MKRQMKTGIVAIAIAASSVAGTVSANAATSVQLNGQPLKTEVAPMRVNGRVLVPMRDIFEALGAKVTYNGLTRGITATRDATTVNLQIGNRKASVNGAARMLEQAPLVVNNRTLVPLRFVSEALGARVAWNQALQIASIDQGGTQVAAARTVSVPQGAVVPVTLDAALSSKTAKVGDTFMATVKSKTNGDAEFPVGTKIEGVVTQVSAQNGNKPGILDLSFRTAVLPDGTRVPLTGTPISLDNDSVTPTGGRIMAKEGKDNTRRNVLIGAGAGFILGKVLDKNSTITAILGAAGGYLIGKNSGKAGEVNLAANTELGVRLDRNVTYADADFAQQRATYFKM